MTLKNLLRAGAFGAGLAGLAAVPGASAQPASAMAETDPQPIQAPDELFVEYTGAVYFLSVANISLSARFSEADYSAAATFESAGLLRWLDDTNIEATAIGYRSQGALIPYRYEHINYASDKGRLVGIDYPGNVAMPDVNPPFGSMGQPPATDAERAGALDPITVMLGLSLAIPGDRDTPCTGTQPVFDGKSRYNLRFENAGLDQVRTRAWRGEAVRCRAYVEPVSGYDPGDRPTEEEIARPAHIWLAPINGAYIPVRFRAATQIGDINVTATRITVTGPASDAATTGADLAND